MSGAELFDLFVGGQTTTEEIAKVGVHVLAYQIQGLRAVEPDDIPMTDKEIAQAILDYARQD